MNQVCSAGSCAAARASCSARDCAPGSSHGAQIYYDDNAFVNGRYESDVVSLEEIKDWLESKCPLLMAEYHEAVKDGRWKDEDDG